MNTYIMAGAVTIQRRVELIPVVARAFAELGYRRTTTAELARRCNVRENVLYRLWPDKKAMFLAAIDYVYASSTAIWRKLLADEDGPTSAERLLEYEAEHHGEFGLYRIVFAGLSECDDPDIREALRRMYQHFQSFIVEQIRAHHRCDGADGSCSPIAQPDQLYGEKGRDGNHPDSDLIAWTIIGLGTIANIGRKLGLHSADERRRLFLDVGAALLDGR